MCDTPLIEEEPWECAQYVKAAAELLARFLGEAMNELQVVAHHPPRGAVGADTAVKFEGRTDGNHHPATEMGFEPSHEVFLLRSSESHPNDVGSILLDHPGDGRIVEVLDRAEGKLDEAHPLDIGVILLEVLLEAVENRLLGPEENHTVLAAGYDVLENLAAAVLLPPQPVDPFYIERHETAVADREHAAVDHPQIVLAAVRGI